MTFRRLLATTLLALPLAALALPATAQEYDRGYGDPPPYSAGPGYDGGGDRDPGGGYAGGGGGAPERSDAAGLAMRVGKLEGRIREMTGQIEELQNANRKLLEQLQRVQDESASGGRVKRGDAGGSGAERPSVATREPAAEQPRPARKSRGDAFDPDSAPQGDPGQPKALGSAAAAADDGAPMDLSGGRLRRSGGDGGDTIAPTLRLPPRNADAGGTEQPVPASTGPMTPREAYDAALGLYRGKQYDDAEKGFAAFIQRNPKSRLVADATYYLGESYAQRGRSREAAEQYLKISKDFSGSARAPDAMLRLGVSMMALGAKEQACATFSEVTRKYPNAPAYVKSGAERESKRAQCG